jgi:uncharacterized membrane protein YeaQ/YmgE (transglycosylase-associated protein family)
VGGQSLVIWLIVGAIVGVLASKVVGHSCFGPIGDVVIGMVGAIVGGLLLSKVGFEIGLGLDPVVIDALVGSLVLLSLVKSLNRTAN